MVQNSRTKAENKPMRLMDLQDSQRDETILKRFTKVEKAQEPKIIPAKIDKISINEMDDNQKQHLMERMSSARQNMSKISFGRALMKKTSENILEKAKNLEEKIKLNPFIHGTNHEQPSSKYVINDPDIQILNELTTDYSNSQFKPIKDVDIESFMKPKNDEQQSQPKKEVRSIADITLKRPAQTGKKKGTTPIFDSDKKE